MQLLRSLLALSAALLAQTSMAYTIKTSTVSPEQMKLGEIYYSDKAFAFEDWKSGEEKAALNLFPNFREGYDKDKIQIWISRASFLVDRPAETINAKEFLNIATIQGLQTGLLEPQPIEQAQLDVFKEAHLAYRVPQQRWCTPDQNKICLKSNFVIDGLTRSMIKILMFAKMKSLTDDGSITAESEVRALNSADMLQAGIDLSRLTEIPTVPASAVFEDFFYFNHFLEFAKVVGVVQPHPQNPNQAIVSTYVVFAIERKWWDTTSPINVADLLRGKAHNTTEGLRMGLPKLTQQLLGKLADWFAASR